MINTVESLLVKLNESPLGSNELQATIEALKQHIAIAQGTAGGSKRNEKTWIVSLVKALLAKLGSGQHIEQHAAAVLHPLISLADACLEFCSMHIKQEDYHALLYSYMKKLSAANELHAAIQCSQQLLADLHNAVKEQQTNTKQSSHDLLLGAGLNIIICSCKLRKGVLGSLHNINQAAGAVLGVLS
jgi:hypothetical protein